MEMWALMILFIAPDGTIEKQWEWKRFTSDLRWVCEARATKVQEERRNPNLFGACVKVQS